MSPKSGPGFGSPTCIKTEFNAGTGRHTMARSALLNVMVQAAMKAGKSLTRDFGEVQNLQVSLKGPGDYVSNADRKAEKIVKEELLKARPTYGFLGEES